MDTVLKFLEGFNLQTIFSMAVIGWYILRHFENKFERRQEIQEERIFLLATGKTLKEAMLEAKKNNP